MGANPAANSPTFHRNSKPYTRYVVSACSIHGYMGWNTRDMCHNVWLIQEIYTWYVMQDDYDDDDDNDDDDDKRREWKMRGVYWRRVNRVSIRPPLNLFPQHDFLSDIFLFALSLYISLHLYLCFFFNVAANAVCRPRSPLNISLTQCWYLQWWYWQCHWR